MRQILSLAGILVGLLCVTGCVNGPLDLQGYIDSAVAAGTKRIVIPPGQYRVVPHDRQHLVLNGLTDTEIVADGAEMICTETTRAISIGNCRNLTLRGLTIDYDPLPFTEGRITALGPDKAWIEFKLFDGYPEHLVPRIEIFDGHTDTLKTTTRYGWQPFESLGNRRYRVAKAKGYTFDPEIDKEEVGDILVTNSSDAPGGQIPHAIVASDCTGLVLEDIHLYASNCFSYFETNCDNSTYRRCSIDRRPPATDLKPRGHRRVRSSDADAFHSKYALRGPQIIGCTARFQGDDCVNICGAYYMLMASRGNQVRLLSAHPLNIEVGDTVELVSYTGERLPDARVTAIAPDGTVTPDEVAFLAKQHMNRNNQVALSKPDTPAFALTLDRAVTLPMGSVIASTRHMGNGFLVQDCDFGFNRSRGILIKASNGRVMGNRLTGNWGSAILVTPEWWWLESGSSNDVAISGNTIANCGSVAIQVVAPGGNGQMAPAGAHNRITVADNRISGSPLPTIYVTSTRDLTLVDNTCIPDSEAPLSAWVLKRNGWEAGKLTPIMTANCEAVSEHGNWTGAAP